MTSMVLIGIVLTGALPVPTSSFTQISCANTQRQSLDAGEPVESEV